MHRQRSILVLATLFAIAYVWLSGGFASLLNVSAEPRGQQGAPAAPRPGLAIATFASGCFWCTESDFDKVNGVISTTSGYTGGTVANPTYRQVSAGGTGHAESVQVVYDPAIVSYDMLLDHFWHNVDPLVTNRQFCDTGNQYRPEIFVHNEAQRTAAEASKARVQKMFREPILVKITPAGPFYPAEDYHQDYYKKNSAQYRFYRFGCGRDRRLEELWGKAK